MNGFIKEYQCENYDTKVVEDITELRKTDFSGQFKILHMNIRSVANNFDEF